MIAPQKGSLKIYNEVLNGLASQKVIDYLILFYKKILEKHNPEKISLVAVLRSGLPLALLLRYIIYKAYNIEIEISAISPNYIDHIDINSFKNYINRFGNDITSIFIDGWCSEGVTYEIVKNFWDNLFPNKKFLYAVLSNVSSFKKEDLLYATNKDILIPWSICQTDNIGLSNYFLHPSDEKSCAFIVPKNKRKIKNSEPIYREIIDRKLKNKLTFKKIDQEDISADCPSYSQTDAGIIKFGVNECIKSIDKKDNIKLYISNESKNSYNEILKKYAKINSVKYQTISQRQSFVIRDFSQK